MRNLEFYYSVRKVNCEVTNLVDLQQTKNYLILIQTSFLYLNIDFIFPVDWIFNTFAIMPMCV